MLPKGLLAQLDAAIDAAAVEELPELLGALVAAEERARLRLRSAATANGNSHRPTEHNPTEGISVGESARRLGVSAAYIYKNAKELPFTIRIGRRLVCSAHRLEQWNRAHLSR